MLRTGLGIVLVLLPLNGVVLGHDSDPEEQSFVVSGDVINRISANLDDIARALEDMRRDQKLLLAIRRIELAERRLAPLNNELQSAREEVRSTQERVSHMEGVAETLRDQVDRAVQSGSDPLQLPERRQLEQVESLLKLQREQLERAEQRVIVAENDLAQGRRRIEILDDELEELFDLLDR
jgi:flagellar biosynthesis chaperone FliJ